MNHLAGITQKCDDLTQLLGTACLPCRVETATATEGAIPIGLLATELIDPKLARIAIQEAVANKRPAIVGTEGNDQSIFAIPICNSSMDRWYGIGILKMPPGERTLQLIRVAVEAAKRMDIIESNNDALLHVEAELGRAFCERQWLRQLGSQRATRKRCIGQHSKSAMESLRALIDAEAVAIFVYSDRSQESHGLESMITGKASWTIDDVRLLLQKFDRPDMGDSVVMNQLGYQLHHGTLRSCVIVPVGESEPLGYLLAINRRKQIGQSFNNLESEFRASDAELLHEAAVYLLADGNSNVQIQESEQLVLGTLRAMSNAIEARDPYTHGHSERVANVGYEIAVRLNLSEVACQEIYLSGILHDIGKIGIPDHVLLKPGKLDADEFAIIQTHPEIGFKILEELGKLKFALPGVLYHHERVDGTGYPHRLKGEQIPLMARILAVSDAYDAMTSSRVYRTAMLPAKAIEILRSGIGSQWDGEAVSACIDYLTQDQRVLCGAPEDHYGSSRVGGWTQVSQALRALQL